MMTSNLDPTTLARREAAVLSAEHALLLREHAAALLESTLRQQESVAHAQSARTTLTESQLREANERLVVATVRAQTMTEAAEGVAAQMSHMATHDFLTGLPNRVLLADRLTQAITHAQRQRKCVALMYLDLDHFKHINDSLGHAVGDQLLQAVSRRLRENVRQSDTVCRFGGDEFVVLLSEVEGAGDATLSAGKLIDALAEPYAIGEHRLHITQSIGISIYPEHGRDVETMLRQADIAMYHGKRKGRNTFQLFAPQMNVRALARQSIEVALRNALDGEGLVLHYQPKVNIASGAITGAEALVRLRQPGHALMYPSGFVHIAEDCGLIRPIGRWVLAQACRQAAAWLDDGLDLGQMAVNVSATEFHGKDFLAGVRATLHESGLDPARLEIEMTESALMQDTQPGIDVLHGLKNLGAQIALDDFGTGYSSLSYLRRFPIDTLKIDQSFVRDIGSGGDTSMLVNAIIAMGKSLRLHVVAEGIETPTQRSYLQLQGCTEGQGFYFGRPVDAAGFSALLAARHDSYPGAQAGTRCAGNPGARLT
ncbi:MAG: EAL domain-containing protein [Rhodoferax sp.]|nr:EAL domain-containing protein [Rhodoferax sp.]